MKWLPITTVPLTEEPRAAIVIARDHDDGEFYTVGIYIWRNGKLLCENEDRPLPAGGHDYWYVMEDDLLLTLPEARLHSEAQARLKKRPA